MRIKYVTAIAAIGLTLAVVRPCVADQNEVVVTPAPHTSPVSASPAAAVPAGYVWDGSEYVGQVGGKYYYLGPRNTWVTLDTTRQHRFQDWQKKNPNCQSHETRNTRYQGHDMGQTRPLPNSPPEDNHHTP